MSTEIPIAVIIPEREDLPSLNLNIKEFGFVAAALNTAVQDEESSVHSHYLFTQGTVLPKGIALKWAQILEELGEMLLVKEDFDSLETLIIEADSYELMYHFEPGTRIDFVLQSEWNLLFRTLIELLKQSDGISIVGA